MPATPLSLTQTQARALLDYLDETKVPVLRGIRTKLLRIMRYKSTVKKHKNDPTVVTLDQYIGIMDQVPGLIVNLHELTANARSYCLRLVSQRRYTRAQVIATRENLVTTGGCYRLADVLLYGWHAKPVGTRKMDHE